MAPDPFTAISLTSSIIQFVHFSTKLFTTGREIRHSSDGATERNFKLSLISSRLTTLSTNLHAAIKMKASSSYGLTDDDWAPSRIAEASQSVSENLLTAIEALKIQRQNSGKWDSFRAALKVCWTHDKIQDLETRLNSLHEQNTLSDAIRVLIQRIRTADDTREVQLDKIAADVKIIQERVSSHGNQERLVKLLEKMREENKRNSQGIELDTQAIIETKNMQDIAPSARLHPETPVSLDPLGMTVSSMRAAPSASLGIDSIPRLGSNDSNEISQLKDHARLPKDGAKNQAIPAAHARTFRWKIEQDSESHKLAYETKGKFVKWLRSETEVFWISGRAGSGKSTLMKFLYNHNLTRDHLQAWAADGNATLILALYFFWNLGSPMQKSLQGLLQFLVSRILLQCPKLIPIACPSRWMPRADMTDDEWSDEELLECLRTIRSQSHFSAQFCFFIDGLDEFDGHHRKVIDVLKDLCDHANVKICLSSRPLNVFEDAFGRGEDEVYKFYLHELTQRDIELYVREKLRYHPNISISTSQDSEYISIEDPNYNRLVRGVVDKSRGVFLRVYLVVRSLRDGLDNCDNLATLHARLEDIPADLERLFQRIIDSIDKVYRQTLAKTLSIAEIFSIAVHAQEPQSLILCSVLETFPASYSQVKPFTHRMVSQRIASMKRQINGRSKGLLECAFDPTACEFWSYRVEFLHRTLRDYLQNKITSLTSNVNIAEDFNVDLALSTGYARLAQVLPYVEEQRTYNNPPWMYMLCDRAFYYARNWEKSNDYVHGQEMQHLRDMVSSLMDQGTFSTPPYVDWLGTKRYLSSMIEFATLYGLDGYVQREMKQDTLISIRKNILYLAHRPVPRDICEGEFPMYPLDSTTGVEMPNEDMVSAIARQHSSPAAWRSYLEDIMKLLELLVQQSAPFGVPGGCLNILNDRLSMICLGRVLQCKPDLTVLKDFASHLRPMIFGAITYPKIADASSDLQDYYGTLVEQLLSCSVCKKVEPTERDYLQSLMRYLEDAPRQKVEATLERCSKCMQGSEKLTTTEISMWSRFMLWCGLH